MVSTWKEYLCVRPLVQGTATAEVCMYEGLGWHEGGDDDGNETELPETYDGKAIAGVDDGILVGGNITALDGRSLTYTGETLANFFSWVEHEHFKLDQEVRDGLTKALSVGTKSAR